MKILCLSRELLTTDFQDASTCHHTDVLFLSWLRYVYGTDVATNVAGAQLDGAEKSKGLHIHYLNQKKKIRSSLKTVCPCDMKENSTDV